MSCIVSMVTDAPIEHKYYEDSLSVREIQRHRKKSFGIILSVSVSVPILYSVPIAWMVATWMSLPESTAGSTDIPKYRILFGIPSSAFYSKILSEGTRLSLPVMAGRLPCCSRILAVQSV